MEKKKYGLLRFLLDLFLIAITGGLYLVYLLLKLMRTHM